MDFIRSIIPATRPGKLAVLSMGFVLLILAPDNSRAEDWMFRRSYYSHQLPPEHIERFPPPFRRAAYRAAIAGTTPGFAIRGAYRYNRTQLGQGRNSDVTLYRQNWFELEP